MSVKGFAGKADGQPFAARVANVIAEMRAVRMDLIGQLDDAAQAQIEETDPALAAVAEETIQTLRAAVREAGEAIEALSKVVRCEAQLAGAKQRLRSAAG